MPPLLALIAAALSFMAILNPVTAAVAATSTSSDAPATAAEHSLAPRGLIAPLLGTPWVMLQSLASISPHPTAMVGTPPVLDPVASVKIPTALQTRVAIAMDGGAVDDDDTPPRRTTRSDATASARSASSTTVIAAATPSISRNSTSTDTDPAPTPTTDAPGRPALTTSFAPTSRTASTTSTTTILPGPRALPPPPADYTLPTSATAPVVPTTVAAPAKPTSDVDSGVDERYRDAHLTPEQVANVETHGTLLQIVGTTDKPAWWTAVAAAKWAPVAVAGVILAATVGGIVGWRRVRRRRKAKKGEMVHAGGDEEGGVATASDAMLEPARS
ncbi:hypothetical protein GGF31_002515 [Allomyces arbusculus]|nr:hypothetical protein GGF31_002515 [Allomyces arbusculus]